MLPSLHSTCYTRAYKASKDYIGSYWLIKKRLSLEGKGAFAMQESLAGYRAYG